MRRRIWRAWVRFQCRWLLVAPVCAAKGHEWVEQHACIAIGLTTCSRCGCFRGHHDKDNGRAKCSRLVIEKPGKGRLEVAKYPPLKDGEWLPGQGPPS